MLLLTTLFLLTTCAKTYFEIELSQSAEKL